MELVPLFYASWPQEPMRHRTFLNKIVNWMTSSSSKQKNSHQWRWKLTVLWHRDWQVRFVLLPQMGWTGWLIKRSSQSTTQSWGSLRSCFRSIKSCFLQKHKIWSCLHRIRPSIHLDQYDQLRLAMVLQGLIRIWSPTSLDSWESLSGDIVDRIWDLLLWKHMLYHWVIYILKQHTLACPFASVSEQQRFPMDTFSIQ